MPRLAVIGFPVGHSRSPAMQNAALQALGLGEEWRYEAIEVAPEGFEARVRAMPGEGFVGANVTVPHKLAALALADVASEAASEIGAANTLSFAAGGIAAENTDAGGLLAALAGAGGAGSSPGDGPAEVSGRRALVLGAGGAARAVCWALAEAGAQVEIWNRTAARAEALVADLHAAATAVREPDGGSYGIVVNTTAVGLHGEDPFAELPLSPRDFSSAQTVVDMVYGERPSPLLEAATAAGAATVDGLEVLVQQGALSFEIWTGVAPDLDVMRVAARGTAHR